MLDLNNLLIDENANVLDEDVVFETGFNRMECGSKKEKETCSGYN